MKFEYCLSYIVLIGMISLMVGLFGMVDGMIWVFYIIVVSGLMFDYVVFVNDILKVFLMILFGLGIVILVIFVYNIFCNWF